MKFTQTAAVIASVLVMSGCNLMPQREPKVVHAPVEKMPVSVAQQTGTTLPKPIADTNLIKAQQAAALAPPPPENIWQRLRAGFSLNIPDNKRVNAAREAWLRNPQSLQIILERGRPYLGYIADQVEASNTPLEMVLLPAIESGFRTKARSHMRAAGLWQFIPSTARLHGLNSSWWYDGRLDVAQATQASLRYLNALSSRFDGDWLLGLAAYNAGPGRVSRALKKSPQAKDYWSLQLPRETQQYVPKLLSLVQIVNDPHKYGISLPEIAPENDLVLVDLQDQIDLGVLSKHSGVSLDYLQQMNPGVRRWATDPSGPHHLLVHRKHQQALEQILAKLPSDERVRWQRYKIRQGDALSKIARRHGVSVAVIKRSNRLKSNKIRAGKHLLIPLASAKSGNIAPIAPETKKVPQLAGNRLYTVRRGDSLWSIARRADMRVSELLAANDLSKSTPLQPGQQLRLRKTAPAAAPSMAKNQRVYKVKQGDSLWIIARRFDTTVQMLREHNALDTAAIKPGQVLNVPTDS